MMPKLSKKWRTLLCEIPGYNPFKTAAPGEWFDEDAAQKALDAGRVSWREPNRVRGLAGGVIPAHTECPYLQVCTGGKRECPYGHQGEKEPEPFNCGIAKLHEQRSN